MSSTITRRMPAEWERHEATWIAWPHEDSDYPGKVPAVEWVYVEIIRLLSQGERVEVICPDEETETRAREYLERSHIPLTQVRFHRLPTDRAWLRDSAPTAVRTNDGAIEWVAWQFNAWAKYDNFSNDEKVPELVSEISGLPLIKPYRPDGELMVLEGGAIETDGEGTLLVTEECLLSEVQQRNASLSREDYEALFREYLGIEKTIWLPGGCDGDDTHGHIDDVARFIAPGVVALAVEHNPQDENYEVSQKNLEILRNAKDARGRSLRVVELPYPEAVWMDEMRLPASYANFYIGNEVVLVPTFNDPMDTLAVSALTEFFPQHQVVGVYARDLVLGQGTFHCLTQQEPAA